MAITGTDTSKQSMGETVDTLTANTIILNGLFTESVTNGITANATQTQAAATVMTSEVNRVTTVATAGNGVKLPASAPGLTVTVINNGANAMQVYGLGADTINGAAAATGVSQAANSVVIYTSAVAGLWQSDAASTLSPTYTNVTLTGLLFESAAGALTANATGTQAAALALATELNRITTAANATSPFSAVALPAATAGLTIMVINRGANPIQVFPINAGSDLIDGQAANAAVTQMSNSMVIYSCTTAGSWDSEGLGTGYAGSLQTLSFTPTTTAFSGGGQGSAVALVSLVNRVSTVAAQGDSVKLPAALPGLSITVLNRGANAMQVFGAGTDTINGIATATGISQGITTAATYVCNVAGNWEVPITTLQSSAPATLSVNGAIPSHTGHTYVITKAGVLADTLAAPTASTDDGIEITITSNTANAHTLTATGLLQTGTASVNVATFAAFGGAGLTLMAYQGKWNVLASVGITFS